MLMNLYTQKGGNMVDKNYIPKEPIAGIHTYAVVGLIATPILFEEGQFIHIDHPDNKVMLDKNVGPSYRGYGLGYISTKAQYTFRQYQQEQQKIGLEEAMKLMGVEGIL